MESGVVDVAIVGGGIVGLSITFALRNSGLSITCIDPDMKPEGHATLAAGAMLGAFAEVTADQASALDREEMRFRHASAKLYPELLAALEDASGCAVHSGMGTFIIATPFGRYDARNLKAIASAAEVMGEVCEPVDPDDIPGYRPHGAARAYQALFLRDEGFIDTSTLIEALRAALAFDQNVSLCADRVASLIQDAGRVRGVRLAGGGAISAGKVVLAAGASTQAVLEASVGLYDIGFPKIVPGKGVGITIRSSDVSLPHVIRTPNRDFACGMHAVPRSAGAIYLGATNRVVGTPGADGGPTAGELHGLLHSGLHEINTAFRTAVFEGARFGSRPLTTDRYPVVGAGREDPHDLVVVGGRHDRVGCVGAVAGAQPQQI